MQACVKTLSMNGNLQVLWKRVDVQISEHADIHTYNRYPHLDFTLAWLLYDELLAVGAREAAERISLEHSRLVCILQTYTTCGHADKK
jgi:hypothetical protein